MNTSSVSVPTFAAASLTSAPLEPKEKLAAPPPSAKDFFLRAIEAAKAKPAAPADSLAGREITAIEPSTIGVGRKRKDRPIPEDEGALDPQKAAEETGYAPPGPAKRDRSVPAGPALTGVEVNRFHPLVVGLSSFTLPGSVFAIAGVAGTEKGRADLSATPKVPGSTIIGRLPAMIAAAKEASEEQAKAAAASSSAELGLDELSL